MKSLYYDRDGSPMTLDEVSKSYREPFERRRRVAETTVGDLRVSTVWLGLDHGSGDGPPLIFETMTFAAEGSTRELTEEEQVCERYATEAEARAGHAAVVAKLEAELARQG